MKIIESLKAASASKIPAPPQPEFTFWVGWASSYEGIFDDHFEVKRDIGSLLSNAVAEGRVLLCGRGGAAKTVVLDRVAKAAGVNGYLPIKVDLKLWNGRDIDRWLESSSESIDRFAHILETANIGLTFPLFSSLPPNLIKLLLIDGLNELQSTIGEQIIQAVDLAVTEQPGTRVIVSDRLVRRELRAPYRWKLASILPLDDDEIRSHISQDADLTRAYEGLSTEDRTLWSSPFFFDAFLKKDSAGASRRSVFAAFFSKVTTVRSELDLLAKAAYDLYKKQSSRTFSKADLHLPPKLVRKAEEVGILKTEGNNSYFRHHLAHDYLAARYMHAHPKVWNQQGFDAISFSASSFDALAMVLEQIESPSKAEKFVRELYDWNPYAAAYCLAEQKDHSTLSYEMQAVVLAVMAERKFNIVDATAMRASDALLVVSSTLAKQFAQTKTLRDVFLVVDSIASEQDWFQEWKWVFTLPPSKSLAPEHVKQLESRDSIMGWTVANVLKRTKATAGDLRFVRSLTNSRYSVVRWRAIHVLGSFPSVAHANTVSKSLDADNDHWVRFGAVRSLVEMAALGVPEVRKFVFSAIRKRLRTIVNDKRNRKELESALLMSGVNRRGEWVRMTSAIFEEIYAMDPAPDARERFSRVANKFREIYA